MRPAKDTRKHGKSSEVKAYARTEYCIRTTLAFPFFEHWYLNARTCIPDMRRVPLLSKAYCNMQKVDACMAM